MALFASKSICCVIVLLINATCIFMTFFYVQTKRSQGLPHRVQYGLSLATCFSVGLLLSICFLGLFSSSSAKIAAIQRSLGSSHTFRHYPVSETLLCLGLFVVWLSELSIRFILQRFLSKNRPRTASRIRETRHLPDSSGKKLSDYIDLPCDEISLLPVNSCFLSSDGRIQSGSKFPLATQNLLEGICFMKAVFLSCAMGIHTLLESIGFGLLDSVDQVTTMGIAMALHQALCSGTLGLRFARASDNSSKRCVALTLLLCYLLLSPLGTLVGSMVHSSRPQVFAHPLHEEYTLANTESYAALSNSSQPQSLSIPLTMAVLQSFSASTILYVIFVEMLPAELSTEISSVSRLCSDDSASLNKHGIMCCLSAFSGFLTIAAVRFVHQH